MNLTAPLYRTHLMDPSKRAVMGRLQRYSERFDLLLSISQQHPMPPEARDEAQELLRSLKAELQHDYKALVTAGRQGTLTQAELIFLLPAVEQAIASLHIRGSADPSSRLWHDEIAAAGRAMTSMLTRLRA